MGMQALVHHLVGRQWRRKLEAAYPEEVAQMLHWFGDQASEQRPFSIHNMCSTGQAYGCVPAWTALICCSQPSVPQLQALGHVNRARCTAILCGRTSWELGWAGVVVMPQLTDGSAPSRAFSQCYRVAGIMTRRTQHAGSLCCLWF